MRTALLTLCTLMAGAAPTAALAQTSRTADMLRRVQIANQLPTRTAEVRQAGVPDTTIRRIFDIFRERNVEPAQQIEILTAERDAAREHGPTDNFGAFVQSQLAAGKRGRALSDAIRAEHRAHGRGQGARPADRQGDRDDDDRGGRDSAEGRRPDRTKNQGQGQSGRGRNPN